MSLLCWIGCFVTNWPWLAILLLLLVTWLSSNSSPPSNALVVRKKEKCKRRSLPQTQESPEHLEQNQEISAQALVTLPLKGASAQSSVRAITFVTEDGDLKFHSATSRAQESVEKDTTETSEGKHQILDLRSNNRNSIAKDTMDEEVLNATVEDRHRKELHQLRNEKKAVDDALEIQEKRVKDLEGVVATLEENLRESMKQRTSGVKNFKLKVTNLEQVAARNKNIAQKRIQELESVITELRADKIALETTVHELEQDRQDLKTINEDLIAEVKTLEEEQAERDAAWQQTLMRQQGEMKGLKLHLRMDWENMKHSKLQLEMLDLQLEALEMDVKGSKSLPNGAVMKGSCADAQHVRTIQELEDLCIQFKEGAAELWSRYYLLLQDNIALKNERNDTNRKYGGTGMDDDVEMTDVSDIESDDFESACLTDYENVLEQEYERIQTLQHYRERDPATQSDDAMEDAPEAAEQVELSEYKDLLESEVQMVRDRRAKRNGNSQLLLRDRPHESTDSTHTHTSLDSAAENPFDSKGKAEKLLTNGEGNQPLAFGPGLAIQEIYEPEISTNTNLSEGSGRHASWSESAPTLVEIDMQHRDSVLQFMPLESAPVQERNKPIDMKKAAIAAAKAAPPVRTKKDFYFFKKRKQCVWCGSKAHQVKSKCDVHKVLKDKNRCEACRGELGPNRLAHQRTCELKDILHLMNQWQLWDSETFRKLWEARRPTPHTTPKLRQEENAPGDSESDMSELDTSSV